MENERAQWGSKLGFILAAAGSAVGLGNIWKFPGRAFEGGGGCFLLIYLLIVIFSIGKFFIVQIDKSAENAERLCLVSYDANAWYNPSAKPIIYCYEHQKSGRKPKRFSVYEDCSDIHE